LVARRAERELAVVEVGPQSRDRLGRDVAPRAQGSSAHPSNIFWNALRLSPGGRVWLRKARGGAARGAGRRGRQAEAPADARSQEMAPRDAEMIEERQVIRRVRAPAVAGAHGAPRAPGVSLVHGDHAKLPGELATRLNGILSQNAMLDRIPPGANRSTGCPAPCTS